MIESISKPVKHPQFKVPSNNLLRLSSDKKNLPITIDVKLYEFKGEDEEPDFVVLRDVLDWDLNQPHQRPSAFARKLVEQTFPRNDANSMKIEQIKRQEIQRLEKDIMDQIWLHVQKQTGLVVDDLNHKQKFSRHEEEQLL